MLIVDDIVTAPFRGLLWVFEEICEAADEELLRDADSITTQLQQLYMMLEGGKVSEAEFDLREAELLDRLDRIQERGAMVEDEDADEE